MTTNRFGSELDSHSDEDLMDIYRRGESMSKIAFQLIFERYAGRVLMFLSKRMQNGLVAEDLTQEVFFKLHRSKHLYNSTLPFSPWLFSIARSVMLDHFKRRDLEDPAGDASNFDNFPTVTESIPSSGTSPEPSLALGRLPEAQSEAIRLRVYENETFDEIALRLSTSPDNARQLFSRGIKKLRTLLKTKEEL